MEAVGRLGEGMVPALGCPSQYGGATLGPPRLSLATAWSPALAGMWHALVSPLSLRLPAVPGRSVMETHISQGAREEDHGGSGGPQGASKPLRDI